jgi:hypothetical protein
VGGRARGALIAAAFLALAAAAVAQTPSPPPPTTRAALPDTAAPDTLAARQIFNDVFAPGSAIVPRIVLDKDVVYRIETEPGQEVSVSYSRRPGPQPLFLVPLEGGPPEASQTASFLVVPRSTEEYRIDILYTTDQPVRLRVWTDPKEMSRWARMRAATGNQPAAGVGVRAVFLGAFVRPHPQSLVFPEPPRGTTSARGVEACLAVVPRGAWISGPVGGCVLAIARFVRPDSAGGLWMLSSEPRLTLSAPEARLEQSVVLTVGIGTTIGLARGQQRTDYLALGLGYQVATRLLGRHLYADAEAGVARMQELGGGLETVGKASIVPRLAAGLQLRF